MDFKFTDEQEVFRQEIRDFLKENLGDEWRGIDPDSYFHDENWPHIRELTSKLVDKGWLTLAWPEEYGGQARPHIEQMIYSEEMAYFRAPTRDASMGTDLVGPTVMIFGTDEQKAEYLPRIADGTAVYCQGFSEPESGSDLASLQLRAVEDGDDYILNGSKIWTSGAHRASHFYLMARTDPDAPKHRGISVFILDMDTPGIEIRPIVNMFDVHYFNQVFFENVRVPKRNMIGEKNRGWYQIASQLDYERSGIERLLSNYRLFKDAICYAKEQVLTKDPLVRDTLAQLQIELDLGRSMVYKVAWYLTQKIVPNYEAAMAKCFCTEVEQRIAKFVSELLGDYAVLMPDSPHARLAGRAARGYLYAPAYTMQGGTSNILRNIIAVRGLGLQAGR